MKNELQKILSYINENYEEKGIVKPDCLGNENNIYIASKKYDLNILIEEPNEGHYLYKKCKYCISLDYNANKKYRSELDWHGGGGCYEYNENDYSNVKEFLDEFCERKKCKQVSIFD